MRNALFAALVLVSALAVTGCPREDSCNILTDGIYCVFNVVEEDGQATVTATFTVGRADAVHNSLWATPAATISPSTECRSRKYAASPFTMRP